MRRLACILSLALVSGCGNPSTISPLPGLDLALPPGSCDSDLQCRVPTPRCDLNTRACVACLPANDNCPRGQKCVPSGGSFICSASCVSDADCPRSDAGTPLSCCAGHCFDTSSDIQHCGKCGATCQASVNATAACLGGECGIGTCNLGFFDCDHGAANGCEVNASTDDRNCGMCGKACTAGANQSSACQNGTCSTACNAGSADCDGNAANGCEVSSDTDASNCGACGNACALANAASVCKAGACTVDACNPGFDDCNRSPRDGCEADLGQDVNHCGNCMKSCVGANGVPVCRLGSCGIASCNAGFADCDSLAINGCEISIVADAKNCGACGRSCNGANSVQACQGAACVIMSCSPGFSDCDKTPANGCEVSVAGDIMNCGGCGNACPVPVNAAASCANAQCGVGQCKFGFADCNKSINDGCEVDLLTVRDCGLCGNVCAAPANATAGCKAGVCGVGICNNLFGDCDNNPGNGCEKGLANDVMNCGKCGAVCNFANAQGACLGGQCGLFQCNPGFTDCDMNAANGCEANLDNDARNCGKCGVVCPQNTPRCFQGACAANLPAAYLGSINGQGYYKVQAAGVMTDNNVLVTCQGAGMKVPCQGPGGCMYNGNMQMCVATQEVSCGNPMLTLSQVICNGLSPPQCQLLNNCFQFMGNAWQNGSSCGALNGNWCTAGNSARDGFAVCTP